MSPQKRKRIPQNNYSQSTNILSFLRVRRPAIALQFTTPNYLSTATSEHPARRPDHHKPPRSSGRACTEHIKDYNCHRVTTVSGFMTSLIGTWHNMIRHSLKIVERKVRPPELTDFCFLDTFFREVRSPYLN